MSAYKFPINQPTLPELPEFLPYLRRIFRTRSITNNHFVSVFEKEAQGYLGVKEVIAVSSCTSGLILCAHALGFKGKVCVPSFTFNATAHALVWNNVRPVFVDCDSLTYNIDCCDLEKKIASGVSGIMAVHVFGNPAAMHELKKLAAKYKVKVLIDGAHALGSRCGAKSVASFADATVFSLAPTKIVTSAEGGLIATDDRELAQRLRLLRNYGNPVDYNCRDIGFNARMSEIHAALGIICFKYLDKHLRRRQKLVEVYKSGLSGLDGITYQQVSKKDLSTYNYFAMVIDPRHAGLTSAHVYKELIKEKIQAKRYFAPPVHKQEAYKKYAQGVSLKKTDELSENILCLPFYSHIQEKDIIAICKSVKKIFKRK
jgi:dTDP-4-amino-4,6-dideoxygalactose transaminase